MRPDPDLGYGSGVGTFDKRRRRRRARPVAFAAFTLIELMIAVCIIGVLASVAIPAYSRFVMQAKGAEVFPVLGTIHRTLAAYWESPRAAKGTNAETLEHCVPNGTVGQPVEQGFYPYLWPGPEKRALPTDNPGPKGLGIDTQAYYYCSYSVIPPEACSADLNGDGFGDCNCPTDGLIFNIVSVCDLDDDAIYGGFNVEVGARGGQLYRAPGYANLPWPVPNIVSGID
jgi:prepilin-type N-terminal cleavage/methylation domain-containing protein